jgi:NAD(P)-dependent dehydrogenase (short-subunit alcohol dehydrogenase family)
MSDFKRLSRSVKGLTVLITGAASGMGRATARVFDADGARAVAEEIAAAGGAVRAWRLDVGDAGDIATIVSAIADHFGGLDIVINNAGVSVRAAIDDPAYDDGWTRGLAVLRRRISASFARPCPICAARHVRVSSTSPRPRRWAPLRCTAPIPRRRPASPD